jgi:RHS repeat-associated protein
VKAEFIWLSPQVGGGSAFGGGDGLGGYIPLAVATPDSAGLIQLNWVHGNHLGVPLATTDAAGNLATTPNDYLAPGFPGQSRVIADLYYNRHRDYDPTTGRYIQADPIGLGGGSNLFAYVGGNPVNRIDPEGLESRDHVTGKTIYCGKGCWIRIDYTLVGGEKIVRHLHWECKGKKGECGEFGEESHRGTWDDAPEFIKDCARRHGFKGDPRPAPLTPSRLPGSGPITSSRSGGLPQVTPTDLVAAALVAAAVACAIAEPCGAAVAAALALGGGAVAATQ